MAKIINKRTLVGFRKAKVNTRYFEDLINQIKNKPEHFIKQVDKFITERTGIKNMKINAIVGNPPYQVMDGGGTGTSAITIYNLFVEIAKKINSRYISMIMPARWYAGGKGLDDFRASMLNDRNLCSIIDYPNPKDCFPTANISGGVCYFLRDKNYTGDCLFSNVVNGKTITSMRVLNEFDVFVRYNRALPIIKKVHTDNVLSDLVFARNPFNLDSSIRGESESDEETDIKVYSSKGIGYLRYSDITTNQDLVGKYKVLMGKVLSGHLGETNEEGQVKVIATLQVASPQEVSTDSYLVIGEFYSRIQANNLIQYLRTKFLRFLLLQSLVSMNISRNNFRFVPLQDFSDESDIDWGKSIKGIDEQLYAKYNLTNEEISFIESMIKPM